MHGRLSSCDACLPPLVRPGHRALDDTCCSSGFLMHSQLGSVRDTWLGRYSFVVFVCVCIRLLFGNHSLRRVCRLERAVERRASHAALGRQTVSFALLDSICGAAATVGPARVRHAAAPARRAVNGPRPATLLATQATSAPGGTAGRVANSGSSAAPAVKTATSAREGST